MTGSSPGNSPDRGLAWLPPVEEPGPSGPALTPDQLAEAEVVARRLHGELRSVLGALPAARRGASALARELAVDRATCQRVVGVTGQPNATAETLVRLPGIAGLRQFLAAMKAHEHVRSAQERVAAASVAVDRFEALLTHLDVSQRGLRARLGVDGSGPPQPAGPDSRSVREGLFRNAAAVTGRWSSAVLDLRIIRPLPGAPGLTEGVRLRGLFGHVASPSAVALETGGAAHLQASDGAGERPPPFMTLDGEPASGDSQGVLLEEFCSRPLPRLTSRNAGTRVIYLVDHDATSVSAPADIVLGTRSSRPDRDPATLDPAVGEMWQLVNFPARRLTFDVFLHREIAARCVPSVEAHLWGPDVTEPGSSRWSTRLPGGPRLEIIKPGEGATRSFARYPEMQASVFARVGWDPAEFVGYRCEVEYPLWRAGYCMAFDFTRTPEENA
jgi:hypothetical protein